MSQDPQPVAFPEPGLAPRPITLDQYMELTPEKLELIQGYLIAPPDWTEERVQLLALLLTNVGLLEALRLAPRELWEEALPQAYPAS
jgi:hypothetical protein